MNRILLAGLSVLTLSALATPAHAIRPELLPGPNQTVERSQEASAQPKMNIAVMQPQSEAKSAEKSATTERPSFEYFERQYLDRYGS